MTERKAARSIFGANANLDGTLGEFEVVRTKSTVPATKGKWWVSLRDGDRQWWHSKAEYTEAQAAAVCRFLSDLSDVALRQVLADKLIRAAQPLSKVTQSHD